MIFGWLPFIAFHHYGSGALDVHLSRVYDDSWLSWVGHPGFACSHSLDYGTIYAPFSSAVRLACIWCRTNASRAPGE
uniref:Putative secreted protein n=1 Tax=Anopheles marajoara TaxID=58244 RepID=A0A2M4CCJ3_9DIPT